MEWLLFFQIIIIFLFLDLKFRNKITYTLFLIPFLLLGFRYKIGWDYDSYLKFYYGMKNVYEGSNFGFKLLRDLFRNFNLSFQVFIFFINCFKIITIAYIANKICKYRSLAIYLYAIIPFFMYRDFSTLRQSISEVFFLLFIYIFILKEKKIGIIFQFGVIFHSAIVLVNFFLVFIKFKIKKRMRYILIIISLILGYFLKEILVKFKMIFKIKIIQKYLEYIYLDEYGKFLDNKNGLNLLLLLLFLLIFIKYQNIFERNKKNIILYNCFYFGMLYIALILYLPSPTGRLSYYVLIMVIFLIPIFIEKIKHNRVIKIKEKNIFLGITYFSILMFSLFFVYENILFPRDTERSLTNNNLKYKFEIFK